MTEPPEIITEEAYRADPRLNASLASYLIEPSTPAHFVSAKTTDRESTIDQEMGVMIHAYILRGVVPDYVQQPALAPDGSDWHGAKNICKAWKKEQEAAGRVILNGKTELRQVRMIESLKASANFQYLLSRAPHRETPVFGTFKGVAIKGLIDAWGYADNGKPFILDLKKARSAYPPDFGKTCLDYGYLLKATWYQALLAEHLGVDERPAFFWAVVEDSEAACVTIIRQTEVEATIGERQMDQVIETFKTCESSGSWPGYSDKIIDAVTPDWAVRKYTV